MCESEVMENGGLVGNIQLVPQAAHSMDPLTLSSSSAPLPSTKSYFRLWSFSFAASDFTRSTEFVVKILGTCLYQLKKVKIWKKENILRKK